MKTSQTKNLRKLFLNKPFLKKIVLLLFISHHFTFVCNFQFSIWLSFVYYHKVRIVEKVIERLESHQTEKSRIQKERSLSCTPVAKVSLSLFYYYTKLIFDPIVDIDFTKLKAICVCFLLKTFQQTFKIKFKDRKLLKDKERMGKKRTSGR